VTTSYFAKDSTGFHARENRQVLKCVRGTLAWGAIRAAPIQKKLDSLLTLEITGGNLQW
jgi:hypothetical protein